jgi:hypothetical protein
MYDWDEEGEEEEETSWLESTGKNVILFLVDGTASMQLRDPEDGRTLYQKALEAACATMKETLATSQIIVAQIQYNSTIVGLTPSQKVLNLTVKN